MLSASPEPAALVIRPMDAAAARAIAAWRYPAPYAVYNSAPDIAPYLVDPANAYFAARTPAGALVGFFCYGAEAQVPGGHRAGLYGGPDVVDIGLGLHPARAGRGGGLAFVRAGLAFAAARYAPTGFRLSVATFNVRAIRVYERAGFTPGPRFTSPTPAGEAEFMLMTRDAMRPDAP